MFEDAACVHRRLDRDDAEFVAGPAKRSQEIGDSRIHRILEHANPLETVSIQRNRPFDDVLRICLKERLEDVNQGRRTPVTLVSRSAENDPDSTAAVIRTLARNEHVAAILGPLTSEYALPAGRLAAEEGVPLVSPTATDARLLEIDPRVYTVNALDGAIGHTIGTFAARSLVLLLQGL